MNHTLEVSPISRPVLVPPGGQNKVLLHSCCAPCSGEVMEALLASGIDYTIYFYNPNIHPLKEYLLRKEENMRFEKAAQYAHENGFPVFTSSLGISRWKNMNQINDCGRRAAEKYPGLVYWDFNWRKGGGSARMIEISKRERFYQQEYCGCAYSLRDSNAHRKSQGRPPIKIGVKYYGDEEDAG